MREGAASRVWLAGGACAALLLIVCAFRPVVEGDGVSYYAYLHAVVVDHGLDVSSVYDAANASGVPTWPGLVDARTATGLRADYFPIGSALLAAPFYLLALALRPSGEPPIGPPFSTAWVLASLLYGLAALALSYGLARSLSGSARAAAISVVGVALATSYTYYLLYEPSYSHTFTTFAMALFVVAWWRRPEARRGWEWLLLGALGGLLALCRWQFGPLVAITLLDWRAARWRLALVGLGYALVLTPQLWVDHVMFGTWWPLRPPGQAPAPWPGHYLDVLVSSNHGLFVWTPIVLLALAGGFAIRDRRFRLAYAYAFLLEVAINGAVPDWWGGLAFAGRRFTELTPFFVVGLAALAGRWRPWLAGAATALFSLWNLLLIANFSYVIRTDHDPGYRGLLAGQLSAVRYLPHLFAQGPVVRALVARPAPPHPPPVADGLLLLVLEAAVLAAALALAGWRWSQPPPRLAEPAAVGTAPPNP